MYLWCCGEAWHCHASISYLKMCGKQNCGFLSFINRSQGNVSNDIYWKGCKIVASQNGLYWDKWTIDLNHCMFQKLDLKVLSWLLLTLDQSEWQYLRISFKKHFLLKICHSGNIGLRFVIKAFNVSCNHPDTLMIWAIVLRVMEIWPCLKPLCTRLIEHFAYKSIHLFYAV